jgi:hypothetical protein
VNVLARGNLILWDWDRGSKKDFAHRSPIEPLTTCTAGYPQQCQQPDGLGRLHQRFLMSSPHEGEYRDCDTAQISDPTFKE